MRVRAGWMARRQRWLRLDRARGARREARRVRERESNRFFFRSLKKKRRRRETRADAVTTPEEAPSLKMARRMRVSNRRRAGPRAARRSVVGNARTRSDPGVFVPSAGGVGDARRAVGVVVAAGCAGGGMCQQRVSKAASVRGNNAEKKGGERAFARFDRAAIARALAREEGARFRTHLARRRARRRAPRAPAAPCRETYARASSRSRPRKELFSRLSAACAERLFLFPRSAARDRPSSQLPFETLESLGLRSGRRG